MDAIKVTDLVEHLRTRARISALGFESVEARPEWQAAAIIEKQQRDYDILLENMREMREALSAMRNDLNELVPMPSEEADLLTGPEVSVFCASIVEAVRAHAGTPSSHVLVLRDIKAEAYQRETVPSQNATKDAIRGTALALSARLGAIERTCRAALSTATEGK